MFVEETNFENITKILRGTTEFGDHTWGGDFKKQDWSGRLGTLVGP